MNFKHKYSMKKDNGPSVYIRFKNDNYTLPNYVGQTEKSLEGRPFRKNARGSKWQGTIKCKSLCILRCTVNRLSTREAYFVLHHKPQYQRSQLRGYFKKAWHLLTKKKLLEILNYMYKPENHSSNDWVYISGHIEKIENAKTKEEEENLLFQGNLL